MEKQTSIVLSVRDKTMSSWMRFYFWLDQKVRFCCVFAFSAIGHAEKANDTFDISRMTDSGINGYPV